MIVVFAEEVQRISQKSRLIFVQAFNALLLTLIENRHQILCGWDIQDSLYVGVNPKPCPIANFGLL